MLKVFHFQIKTGLLHVHWLHLKHDANFPPAKLLLSLHQHTMLLVFCMRFTWSAAWRFAHQPIQKPTEKKYKTFFRGKRKLFLSPPSFHALASLPGCINKHLHAHFHYSNSDNVQCWRLAWFSLSNIWKLLFDWCGLFWNNVSFYWCFLSEAPPT